jgi:protein-L-isoaspartate(D-aspartate) O-methyltransferase
MAACLLSLWAAGCTGSRPEPEDEMTAVGEMSALDESRERMVETQIEARGVTDARVLAALRAVPRHELVPEELRDQAYEDHPLPIGYGQTISQPYVVAVMSEALDLDASERVLEVGTGSGYQAAVLGRLAKEVYSIEIVEPLAQRAQADLARLGYANVHVRHGDGYRGWPEQAPFDAIVVTAAPDHVPQPLVDQLAPGGRLVIPVGSGVQELLRITRDETGVHEERMLGVRFVPMTGEAQE